MRDITRYSGHEPPRGGRVTTVEFGMIAALIALMIASAVSLLGPALVQLLGLLSDLL